MIQLGRYEQDGNIRNGNEPIDWIVLKIQDGKALLVSKYALDVQQYNKGYSQDANWEDCWLRKWLNNDFLTAAFNSEECSIISGTQDKLFLLSIDDAKKYFSSDAERQCKLTEYAEQQGASSIDGYCWWWLQPTENIASVVGYKGDICDYGNYVHIDSDEHAVRPVMWIEIGESNKTDETDVTYKDPVTNQTPGMFLDYKLGDPVLPDYVSKQTITIDEVNGHLYFESTDNTTVDSLYWVSSNSNGNKQEIIDTAHERIISYFENRYGLGKEVVVPGGVFPHYWGFDDETATQFITGIGLAYLVSPDSEYNIYVVQIKEPYE